VLDVDTAELEPGTVLGNRFRVERKLGEGSMGAVLAATDLTSNRQIALKLMRTAVAGRAEMLERFEREAEVLRSIDHPSVVSIEDAGMLPDGTFFIALELLVGETLRERLRRDGPMPPELLVPLVRGLCDALGAVHTRAVVHRDIKPANIFLPERSTVERASITGSPVLVKIVDFGVAKVWAMNRLTQEGIAVGTFRYMAPEQLGGVEDLDGRADLYSVGVVLFEALAGEHPFQRVANSDVISAIFSGDHPPLRQVNPQVPAAVAAIVGKAMAVNRDDRYASAAGLAEAFAKAVHSPPDR